MHDDIKERLAHSRLHRQFVVTDEETELQLATLFTSDKTRARLFEAATAPTALVRNNFSHWSVQFVFALQSGQVMDPIFARSNLLEEVRDKTIRRIWQIFLFSLLGLLSIIVFVWWRILRPNIRNLANTQAQIQVLLDNIPAAVCGISPDYKIVSANNTYRRTRSISDTDIANGLTVKAAVGDKNWPILRPHLEDAFAGQASSFDILFAASENRMTSITYAPLIESKGTVTLVIAFILDIHARYQSERQLRISEENLRITLNSIGDAVIATNTDGRVTRMNPIAEQLTGWSAEEATGRPLSEVFVIKNSQTGAPVPSPVERVLETGHIIGLANHTALISREGPEFQIADSGAPIRDTSGKIVGVVLVFRDVTDEYLMEQRISSSEKMQAIGQLAGGIAHDFNNSLAAILGAVELIELHDGKNVSEKSKKLIRQIIGAAEQSSELVDKLTAFARVTEYSFSTVDLHTIIEDTLELLKNTIDRRISINCTNDAKNTLTLGNTSSLQAVFMNIGINAIQAMPDGGELRIKLENCTLTERETQLLTAFEIEPGAYVRISISDSGTGIPDDLLPRIFDPFFTTKSSSEGTGLGLAAALGTVQDHKGAITVRTRVQLGTTFTILLPTANGPLEKTQHNSTPPSGQASVTENSTILLVEDEDDLRDIANSLLDVLGYRVLFAQDGKEGVEIYAANKDLISAVLLDINMPRMDGGQALAEMKAIDPNVCAIIVSGFAEEAQSDILKDPNVFTTLRKPYTLNRLRETLVAALTSKAQRP
ncbi:PAS/PAC sensor hybrid histidine kinase [Roseibium sp. TrichSKD4]|nr:PAS/PAC sensor hybrid histidine kinase [Roseibium sp. TrichSKD4]